MSAVISHIVHGDNYRREERGVLRIYHVEEISVDEHILSVLIGFGNRSDRRAVLEKHPACRENFALNCEIVAVTRYIHIDFERKRRLIDFCFFLARRIFDNVSFSPRKEFSFESHKSFAGSCVFDILFVCKRRDKATFHLKNQVARRVGNVVSVPERKGFLLNLQLHLISPPIKFS